LTDPNLWGIEKDMAKRQTRRSISVSRSTYERLRAYCETNGISMSQFVEHRVGDFLGRSIRRPPMALAMGDHPAPVAESLGVAAPAQAQPAPMVVASTAAAPAGPAPTRAAIVPRPAPAAPPPAKLTPDQIFTF
jgi:hypothetical protein